MILSSHRISTHFSLGNIVIEPWNKDQLNPNSYNVRLAPELKVYNLAAIDDAALDPKSDNPTQDLTIPENGLILEPGNLYLGKTIEYTESPIHVPMLEGRSSLARLGLWVHVTAGFGDKGFKGHWTLEIACIHPTRIYPGMEIAQLSWYDIDQDGLSYQDTGKYNNRRGSSPGASQAHKDF